ncbi:YicC/YloC family endoribonuclease [Porticoccus sp.]|uniref:YicC/YloC family endoribonuclease n=1 Tax=Porticoccus sp. TaxID=2024853 RepID=UPI000C3ABD15|nr:YicC/YloC family endoribonuclease [Porticoccus sp.]MAZ70014.1 YicC family protein [Porticoccus sp.]|tara:strand:- start:14424 stop:15287 length:864 start_codon:yes stop_codon:yes gene_type:complete
MPSSMTAFARHSIECHWGTAAWEIRSVNHRYLETGFRMPETVRDLEATLRELTRKHLQRGKVDCTLQLNIAKQSGEVAINQPLAEQYITASEQLARLMADPAKISPLDILRWPGVLSEPEIDREELKNTLLRLFEETLDQLVEGRRREGGKLGELVEQRLDGIAVQLATVRSRLPELLAAQRQKLIDRLQEVSTDLDQNRLEQELVLIAQRADVDEELDRLDTHLGEIRRVLQRQEPIGRRLDFLMQELNREANTLSSKAIATDTTNAAIELKVLIEQMREQIQNIE